MNTNHNPQSQHSNVAPDAPHSHHGRMAPVFHRNFKIQTGAHQQKHESFVAHVDFHAALHAKLRDGARNACQHRVFFV